MSLLCFSMDLHRTREEVAATAEMTEMAYGAWVLVNDYFSWEKEWKNYTANGSVGLIVSAVWFFMKWHSVDVEESKRMIRKEIMAREEKYEQMRDEFLARGNHSRKTLEWINLLDNVTAGNFVWSMTTARYHTDVEDSYPGLRKAHLEKDTSDKVDSLSIPISVNAAGEETRHDSSVGTPTKSQTHDPQMCELAQDGAINDGSDLAASQESSESCLLDFEAVSTSTTAWQLTTNNGLDCAGALPIHRHNAVERREELRDRWC
jgi:predicted secreted protein